MNRARVRDQHGFALVAVLWILVLVGALAVEFHSAVRADQRLAANAGAAARGRWAARAGYAHTMNALDALITSDSATRRLSRARPYLLPPWKSELDGVTVVAEVTDARSRVHLNLAERPQLHRLFVELGFAGSDAALLADRILDWRDPDGARRPGGAEAADYAALQPTSRPRNAPFQSVEEVRGVLGVSSEVFDRIRPHLTVVGDGRINVNSAPAPVIATLPGLDGEGAAALVARRERTPYSNLYEVLEALPRHLRSQVQTQQGGFADQAVFFPREAEILVVAAPHGSPIRSQLRAVALMSGGTTLSFHSVVER